MGAGVVFENNQGPITVKNDSQVARATILGKLIEIIATSDSERIDLDRDPAEIEVKISFNDINNHRWLIDEYVDNSSMVDESISLLNKLINNGSTKLKRQMKLFYFSALSNYNISTSPFDLPKLKSKSDDIVREVINQTTEFVKSSSDLKDGYFDEDINFGVALIVSYSIIECIVLENPNDHD
ncbi:hypothetical protein [Microbulbifer sp. MCCC 1A16149]|uniref:hypothetical protein n=1 Tax=Microbulbifer sp. MCCC 1A16149 TaxID=3411322 RepID=UPI003D108A4C